jgi:flagellar hook assembly protein FlgD
VSPDGDGFQDALLIRYSTPGPGWNARLRIYDANGRLIKVLSRSELLAGEGTIIWDGTNDDEERARTGIYIILVERFEPQGGTSSEKLVAVVVNPK